MVRESIDFLAYIVQRPGRSRLEVAHLGAKYPKETFKVLVKGQTASSASAHCPQSWGPGLAHRLCVRQWVVG